MKTFDQYIDEYLDLRKGEIPLGKVTLWLSESDAFDLGEHFKVGEFNLIPFEFKWGLFKFICDDLNINFMDIYLALITGVPRKSKIHDICPIEFINLITGI